MLRKIGVIKPVVLGGKVKSKSAIKSSSDTPEFKEQQKKTKEQGQKNRGVMQYTQSEEGQQNFLTVHDITVKLQDQTIATRMKPNMQEGYMVDDTQTLSAGEALKKQEQLRTINPAEVSAKGKAEAAKRSYFPPEPKNAMISSSVPKGPSNRRK